MPRGVEVPDEPPSLGADYDTDWARSPAARVARGVLAEGPLRLAVRGLADPEIFGTDRLADLRRQAADSDEPPPPLIFAPNHHSHLDTALMVRAVPFTWRKRLVVAAAADYFFDKRWKATLAALSLNAIPIDRESTGRRSADMIRELVDDGWSLVIYPEGGRSPDGWGQDVQGRRRLPVGAHRRAGRAGVHRRHRLDLRQGHEAAQAGPHPGRVRRRRCARERREHAPLQRPHRGRRHRRSPTRRRPTAGRPAGAPPPAPARALGGPELHRLAPAVGPVDAPPRRASPAGAARRRAAGPTSADSIAPTVRMCAADAGPEQLRIRTRATPSRRRRSAVGVGPPI